MTAPIVTEPSEPVRPARSGSRVQSVDRAAGLLHALGAVGDRGAGTVALAETCGLNRATAWRILWTLADHALADHDPETGRWRLGRGLIEIAGRATPVLHDAHRALERLALRTGETAALAVLRRGRLTYVDEVAAPNIVTANWSGHDVSLHATSTGKVLLAWSSPEEAERITPKRLTRYTSTTITRHQDLRAELERTRERGYATCHGEFDEAAWGVSAPVLDRGGRLMAVLSVWGPGNRVVAERLPALGETTAQAAAEMSPG